MSQLNKEFQAKYPNVTIKRVSRSFDDLKTTLRLALSGNQPPDVVEANNGRSDMGAFVKAGQLRPLDAYAKAYGWDARYPESVRQYSSYSPDGKTFGQGSLYGLPQVGEVVGIYYNAKKLAAAGVQPPKTWAEFEAALAAVKAKGEVPMMFGNLDKWPAIHVFGTVQGRTTPADAVTQLGVRAQGRLVDDAGEHQGRADPGRLGRQGLLRARLQRPGLRPGVAGLQQGQGRLPHRRAPGCRPTCRRPWVPTSASCCRPARAADAKPVATGGTGPAVRGDQQERRTRTRPRRTSTSSPTPHAMQVLTKTGNLPVADTAAQQVGGGLQKDVFTAFGTVVKGDGLLPYLDYATPTMYDTLGAGLQDLLAKKATPQQFLERVQKDYSDFSSTNG